MIYNRDYKNREYTEMQKRAKTVDIVSSTLFISICIMIIVLILRG